MYNSDMGMRILFFGYLAGINLLAFFTMGLDKQKAVRHAFRIPEAVLFLFSLIGGSAGTLAGMFVFHHKTRKLRFMIGIPLILLAQISLAAALVSTAKDIVFY